MTKHDDTQSEVIEESNDSQEEVETVEQTPEVSEVDQLKADNEALSVKYLEALAEIQNIRKRNAQEFETLQKFKSQKVITELLPILDSFELALGAKAKDENPELANFLKGFELLFNQFNQMLESEGVTFIDAKGQKFDHNLHDAIMQVEDTTLEDDVVVEQLQKGYVLKDRILRPALVKVNKLS